MIEQLTDTLTANRAFVESFRDNPSFNYDRQLGNADTSLLQDFYNAIDRLIREMFHVTMPESDSWLWPIIMVVFALAVLWAAFRYGLPIFNRITKKRTQDYDIEDEDINTVDFDREISRALAVANYRSACRLVYLKTLKALSDAGAIDWKLFKTPMQYTTEVHDGDFNALTNHFLRIRYGDFEASRALYDEMLSQHDRVCATHTVPAGEKGGDA